MRRRRYRKNRPPLPDRLPRRYYPAVFGDYDGDGLRDVDDPAPWGPQNKESLEEVRLSDEVAHFLRARRKYVKTKNEITRKLRRAAPRAKVQGRVKSPYSIINKLRRKRLKTLTDIAAARIILPNRSAVERIAKKLKQGYLGRVLEHEDFYKRPLDGYRAHHFIVQAPSDMGPVPVEVQVKSRRMNAIAEASHTPYKKGKLDGRMMARLTTLADAADHGDRGAAQELAQLLKNTKKLERALTRRR